MNNNHTQVVSINKHKIARALITLQEFREHFRMLITAKADNSLSPSEVAELEKECKTSMIRVLMEEHPEWSVIRSLPLRQIRRFLVNLNNSTSPILEGDFPSIAGTYWAWPPSQEFIDYVDHWICKHTTDIEERRY